MITPLRLRWLLLLPVFLWFGCEKSEKAAPKAAPSAKSSEANITAFSFPRSNNPFLTKDSKGYITLDDREIDVRSPYLASGSYVAAFTVSPGATVSVNGVPQISGQTPNNFSADVTYEVVAQNGAMRSYRVRTTVHILDIADFLQECPLDDQNIAQILRDFEFRVDGQVVQNFPCTSPYYPMTNAQFNDQVKWLQTLRLLFYLDYGQSRHLPWTSLRIYDWVKSKIGGINILTGLNGGFCCTTFNGRPFITVGALKNNTFGNLQSLPDLRLAFSINNVPLLLHEVRHLDGFPHSNCCPAGAGRCDNEYDLKNLSPYGMHNWWNSAVLNRQFDFGFNCQSSDFIRNAIDSGWNSIDQQKGNFCTSYVTPTKPAYWNDCRYK